MKYPFLLVCGQPIYSALGNSRNGVCAAIAVNRSEWLQWVVGSRHSHQISAPEAAADHFGQERGSLHPQPHSLGNHFG
jgi:hypothetical protein